MEELLKLIEENKSYTDVSDELMKYYCDSGSFSNVYSSDNIIVKVFFDFNELLYLESYLTDKVKVSLNEMMHTLNYLNKKEYENNDYINFILDEMIKEPEKLNELSCIESYPKVKSFNKDYVCMERVDGIPLFQLDEEKISEIPEKSWLNLIDDLYKVVMMGYRPIDLSENNVFWSEEDTSFYLIDVGLYIKDYPKNLHTPSFLKKEKYKSVFQKLKTIYHFDLDYKELDFN